MPTVGDPYGFGWINTPTTRDPTRGPGSAYRPIQAVDQGGGFGGQQPDSPVTAPRLESPSTLDDPYAQAALDRLGDVSKQGILTQEDIAQGQTDLAAQAQAAANQRGQSIARLGAESGEVAGGAAMRAANLRNQQTRQSETIAGQAALAQQARATNRTAGMDAATQAAQLRLQQYSQGPRQVYQGNMPMPGLPMPSAPEPKKQTPPISPPVQSPAPAPAPGPIIKNPYQTGPIGKPRI